MYISVFLWFEEGVLILEELGECYECVSYSFVKVDGLAEHVTIIKGDELKEYVSEYVRKNFSGNA